VLSCAGFNEACLKNNSSIRRRLQEQLAQRAPWHWGCVMPVVFERVPSRPWLSFSLRCGQCGAVWGMKMAPRRGKDWRMLIVWRQTGSKMLCYALYLQILWAASILPCGWAPMWVHGGRNKFCILAHTVAVVLVLWRRPAGTVVGTYLSVGSGSCHVLSAQESKTLVVSEWIKTPVAWPSHLWWFSGHWASKVPVTLEAQDTWRRQQLSDTVSAKG